jgi:tetratricopeptide (TPR) repeat protein
MKHAVLQAAALLAALVVAGCGTSPTAAPTAPAAEEVVARMPPPASAFERRLRDRALSQGRQGRLAEAAVSWEILTVLRPDAGEYRDRLADIRRLIDTSLPDRLQRGAQALKRGDLDAASLQYLAALSLQPDHAQAADALRQIERERNKRSYLGKHSRSTLTRRAMTEAQMANTAPAVPLDRNEVEHASMLATQGEHDDAIALLERHLAVDKRDAAACQLLADIYFQKAEKQLPRDRSAALVSFEKGMRLDAANPRVAAKLKQLKNGNGNPVSAASCASRAL